LGVWEPFSTPSGWKVLDGWADFDDSFISLVEKIQRELEVWPTIEWGTIEWSTNEIERLQNVNTICIRGNEREVAAVREFFNDLAEVSCTTVSVNIFEV